MIYMIKELFLLEHKKLWKKKSVQLSFLLCVLYIVVFGSFLSYQWFTFGSSGGYSGFSNDLDGYDNIRKSQEYANQWEGELTDEVLQKIVSDYQRLDRAARSAYSAGDTEQAKEYSAQTRITDFSVVDNWIGMLYPELEDASQDYPWFLISYVDPEKLTGFYERRQQKVEEYLEIFGHTEEEKEFLLRMNERVEEPYNYQWVNGWKRLVGGDMLPEFGIVIAVFIVIALSTVFSGEWHNGTGMLMLTTKNGWKETAYAKVLSGVAFTVELFSVTAVGAIAGQLIYLGTAGWDMPIQYIKLIAVAPMNMLQAEIYEYTFTLLGAIGLALFVMFFSAVAKNNFIALVSSLAVVYLPGAIENYVPMSVQRWMELLPLVGSSSDIFRTNVFHLFGQIIWSPYLLVTVPVLLGCALIPFTIGRWARRLRK